MLVNNKIEETFESFKDFNYSEKEISVLFDSEEKIKAKLNDNTLQKYKDEVSYFYRMLKDSFAGKYCELKRESVAVIVSTLLYLNESVDVIPDFIPSLGLSDDAQMLSLCCHFVAKDVERYKLFIHLNREVRAQNQDK